MCRCVCIDVHAFMPVSLIRICACPCMRLCLSISTPMPMPVYAYVYVYVCVTFEGTIPLALLPRLRAAFRRWNSHVSGARACVGVRVDVLVMCVFSTLCDRRRRLICV